MKALVWHGEQNITLEEFDQPVANRGEVIFEVKLAGICGSDLHGYRGHPGPRIPPLVLGHEAVGVVNGSRHVLYPIIGCGTCRRCQSGSDHLCDSWRLIGMHRMGVFAECTAVPQGSLVSVPGNLTAERAVLAEPLACCVSALRNHVQQLSPVVVLGCGPIGLLAVLLAARAGAEVTAVDPVAERRAHAEKLGAHRTVASAATIPARSAELVVDAVGHSQTWREAIATIRSGGIIVMIGLGESEGLFPMAAVVRRGITLQGHFAYSRQDFADALNFLAVEDFNSEWVTTIPLVDGAQAFAELVSRPDRSIKVLLRP